VERVIPVLRMFDVGKAREFYVDWLGFRVDWEHRFEENLPLYMQISLGDCVLHLSEHHGDGSPGAVVYVKMRGLEEWHRELMAKGYKYMRPGIEKREWGVKEMGVIDPAGNRIRFSEDTQK
jgi:catechol 2,3-dioxygenase-like lactoylglutathione lyase family enzyme